MAKHSSDSVESYTKSETNEILRKEDEGVRKEREALNLSKFVHVHFAKTIKLNVGGQYFTTSLETLTKDPGSMLHAMFSGRFDTKPAEDGSYFIDRDGTHFRHILNFLRQGKLCLPDDDATIRKEVLAEAEFYQIQGIIDELKPKPFAHSTILSVEQRKRLTCWIKKDLKQPPSLVLLYRASRDGWESIYFHWRCDNKGPTITVVKSGNFIFGGYADVSCNTASKYFIIYYLFIFIYLFFIFCDVPNNYSIWSKLNMLINKLNYKAQHYLPNENIGVL